ncbi:hypothetical protein Nepgr_003980 [Nepenthes gracilis]|uniref:Uncharacterized protein n=1 Tax=Nepenthes gracilis TaxID=150966 RepID=A0AAD3S0H5_NEPGR|nr:hypothetical protein Nepgr_003980 [Nepenthes gracilis]
MAVSFVLLYAAVGRSGVGVPVALLLQFLMALGSGYDASASAFAVGNLGVLQCAEVGSGLCFLQWVLEVLGLGAARCCWHWVFLFAGWLCLFPRELRLKLCLLKLLLVEFSSPVSSWSKPLLLCEECIMLLAAVICHATRTPTGWFANVARWNLADVH